MTLLAPQDRTTRPITDRVKESLFSILAPVLEDTMVADLFCGTGSLALEALSRGSRFAIMADKDSDAIKRLRQNIAKLNFQEKTMVTRTDLFKCGIPAIAKWTPSQVGGNCPDQGRPYDLIFVDPPYVLSRDCSGDSPLGKLLFKISDQVAPDALVVLRHERRSNPLGEYQNLRQTDRRDYGSMSITFFKKA